MLLVQGKIVYFNEAQLACDYFASLNYNCPNTSNPADYFMALMSLENVNEFQNEESSAKKEEIILKEFNKRINYLN